MRHAVTVLAVAAVMASAVHASDALQTVVASYLEVHAALAADKTEGVAASAKAIGAQAATMGTAGEPIAKAAKALESAADLKAARTAFGELSDAVIAATKADPKAAADVKVAFCPMAKKPWLQKGDQIRNPYYGTSMLTCGEFKK